MLCPGCFSKKKAVEICSECGYDETVKRSSLLLPHHSLLNNGRYLVGRSIGRPGGFGITYLALDERLGNSVAIKEYIPRDLAGRDGDGLTVFPHSTDDEELFEYGLTRFLEEARTLAKLDHPNIVRVRDFFAENGTAYLVMDYCRGLTLSSYITRQEKGKVTHTQAISIILPILDGLREVHQKGFLHRDIKPQNIYLTSGNRPMLLDFGAARQAMGEKSRSLSVILSEGYAPPEQYQRNGMQGPWTDIYGVAATIYFMVVGETPPSAIDRLDYADLPKLNDFPKTFEDSLIQGLALKVEDRSSSVADFMMLLNAAEEDAANASTQTSSSTIGPGASLSAESSSVRDLYSLYCAATNEKPGSYYVEQFKSFDEGSSTWSFNIYPLLAGPFWLYYRGIWSLLLLWVGCLFLPGYLGAAVSLGFLIYLPNRGNYEYYKKIRKWVDEASDKESTQAAIMSIETRRRNDGFMKFVSAFPIILIILIPLGLYNDKVRYEHDDITADRVLEITRQADEGKLDSRTLAILGHAYHTGKIVAKDDELANRYIDQSVSSDDAVGMYYKCGILEDNGDISKAIEMCGKSEARGQGEACVSLSWYYMNHKFGVYNPVKALEYAKKAAYKYKRPEGLSNLAYLYEYGIGVDSSYQRAIDLYKQAIASGEHHSLQAEFHLAEIYFYGKGVRRDESAAAYYYGKVAEAGNDWGADQSQIDTAKLRATILSKQPRKGK